MLTSLRLGRWQPVLSDGDIPNMALFSAIRDGAGRRGDREETAREIDIIDIAFNEVHLQRLPAHRLAQYAVRAITVLELSSPKGSRTASTLDPVPAREVLKASEEPSPKMARRPSLVALSN